MLTARGYFVLFSATVLVVSMVLWATWPYSPLAIKPRIDEIEKRLDYCETRTFAALELILENLIELNDPARDSI